MKSGVKIVILILGILIVGIVILDAIFFLWNGPMTAQVIKFDKYAPATFYLSNESNNTNCSHNDTFICNSSNKIGIWLCSHLWPECL